MYITDVVIFSNKTVSDFKHPTLTVMARDYDLDLEGTESEYLEGVLQVCIFKTVKYYNT